MSTTDAQPRLERVADALAADTRVVGVDTFPPTTGPHNDWTLHATIRGDVIPASVLRELALEDCAVLHVSPQAVDFQTVLAKA